MKTILLLCVTATAVTLLSGCAGAAFNRIELKAVRNVSVGQELIDLQAAHENGAISDEEYARARRNILDILNQLGEINAK